MKGHCAVKADQSISCAARAPSCPAVEWACVQKELLKWFYVEVLRCNAGCGGRLRILTPLSPWSGCSARAHTPPTVVISLQVLMLCHYRPCISSARQKSEPAGDFIPSNTASCKAGHIHLSCFYRAWHGAVCTTAAKKIEGCMSQALPGRSTSTWCPSWCMCTPYAPALYGLASASCRASSGRSRHAQIHDLRSALITCP